MIFRRSLTFKLIAAFLSVSLLAVALVALFGGIAAATEFNRFVWQEAQGDFTVFVTDYYSSNGDLAGIDNALRKRIENRALGTNDGPRIIPFALADPKGKVLIPGEGYQVGQAASPAQFTAGTRVLVDGRVIGVVLPFSRTIPRSRAQDQYLERTGLILALAAGGGALVAIVLGVWLARTITRPVRELTGAAQRLAKGELGQTVRVESLDEVGQLATAFNEMSTDLARADSARRQMTADIAHELRNPLTVIGGYLDAMRGGDLQPTPARLETVFEEIQHLEHIVDDLRTLSLADAGALTLYRETIPALELLRRVAARHAPSAAQKQISLTVKSEQGLPTVFIDEARMTQVLDNLVRNALDHTSGGGAIELRGSAQGDFVYLMTTDSGEGIAPQDLPHIFERFYRVDKSRESEAGSSGLGLAIAKALVEAHGGRIWAESDLGHGSTFVVQLPHAEPTGTPPEEHVRLTERIKLAPAS